MVPQPVTAPSSSSLHESRFRLPVRYGPGDGKNAHPGGTGAPERPGTLADGCPGGENIVHDKNPAAFYDRGIGDREGFPHVLEPLFPAEAGLGLGPGGTDQGMKAHRQVQAAGKGFGDERALVEASLPQPLHMEGNGDDEIYPLRVVSVECRGEQFRKGWYPAELASEFQLVDTIPHHPGMDRRRAGAFIGRRRKDAVPAQVIDGWSALGKGTATPETKW